MKIFLSFLSLVFPTLLFCQNISHPIICGNEIFSDLVRKNYPSLQEAFDRTFHNAVHTPSSRNEETLIVPVVVHVVWNAPEENLHDSIILNQIRILNEDFNRTNPDTANLRAMFQTEAGSANIEFELVDIIRVQTDQLFVFDLFSTSLFAEVKYDEDGGSTAWDPESYLNIWITKLQPIEILGFELGQVLGFAFPPNGLDHWPEGVAAPVPGEDGVVLDYRIIGSNNPNTILIPMTTELLTVQGRTATHEVGHYLGLRHIWGDGSETGTNDCMQSDGIYDTPFANAQSLFDCDINKNSCPQVEDHYNQDMPDLVENFMDYARDDCMNMFTEGQVSVMRNVLQGPRSGLIESVSSASNDNRHLDFTLSPNPTDGKTVVQFSVDAATEITIRISDISGHLTLANVRQQYLPGVHEVPISLQGMSQGMYFIELRTKDHVGVQKLILQ